jgi:hypothetical protein
MKIRNHRKREWWFKPYKDSKLERHLYRFKYKSDMMKFLNNNFHEVLNGTVCLDENSFGHSGVFREWHVWYNRFNYKIELKQLPFRNKKYVFKKRNISKIDKKYFAFSNKVISLMCDIADSGITKERASKLITLFEKRGFKDFEPDEDDLRYINGHIEDGIDFYYWSDRCNFLRCKVILEYFKRENLL